MEDILASIRRIIADDEALPPPEPEQLSSSPLNSVLDIAGLHVSPLSAMGPNEPVLGPWSRGEALVANMPSEDDVAEDRHIPHVREEQAPVRAAVQETAPKAVSPVAATEAVPAEILISNETGASVSSAFDRLSASLRPSQPQTVEDLMKEMLRPMLRAWLDDNLPSLVERLVRDEIERVTRSRG